MSAVIHSKGFFIHVAKERTVINMLRGPIHQSTVQSFVGGGIRLKLRNFCAGPSQKSAYGPVKGRPPAAGELDKKASSATSNRKTSASSKSGMTGGDNQQSIKLKKERRGWSDEAFKALLSLLENVVASGKTADAGQLKPGTFRWLEQKLEAKFPEVCTKMKPHIESIMQRLKTEYTDIYDMLNTSGIGWDNVNKKIHVDFDDVWNADKESKGDVNLKNFMAKTFPYYDQLMIIFGKDRAIRRSIEALRDMLEEIDEKEYLSETNTTLSLSKEFIGLSGNESASKNVNQNKIESKFTGSKGRQVCKRSKGEDVLASSVDKFADKLVDVVSKYAERMGVIAESVQSIAADVKVVKDFYDIDSRAVACELMKMKNLTPRERNKAGRLLIQNLPLVHLFWGFEEDHRVQFVKDLLKDN